MEREDTLGDHPGGIQPQHAVLGSLDFFQEQFASQ